MNTVGERLKWARERLGIGQTELANRAGLKNQSSVGSLESGHRQKSSHVPALAAALGVDAEWLATGKGTPTPAAPSAPALPPTVPEMLEALREKIAALPEAERAYIAKQVFEYMQAPSADTGHAFAEAIAKILKR